MDLSLRTWSEIDLSVPQNMGPSQTWVSLRAWFEMYLHVIQNMGLKWTRVSLRDWSEMDLNVRARSEMDLMSLRMWD